MLMSQRLGLIAFLFSGVIWVAFEIPCAQKVPVNPMQTPAVAIELRMDWIGMPVREDIIDVMLLQFVEG